MTPGLLPERPRQTLAAPTVVFRGVGLHSGADASVRVIPAPPGTGRRFRDLNTGQEIAAVAANSIESERCSIVRGPSAAVQTIEHLLSAMAALGIDDAVIETSGGEIPAADGSAAPFVGWLEGAGVVKQPDGSRVDPLKPAQPMLISGKDGAAIALVPASHFRAVVLLQFPQPWIGTQSIAFDAAADTYRDIAGARTFGFVHELDWLRSKGLAMGATYDNCLALSEEGYVGEPRMTDELVRHKLLDLIGDLAMLAAPVAAEVIAIRPSHALTLRLARALHDNHQPRHDQKHS